MRFPQKIKNWVRVPGVLNDWWKIILPLLVFNFKPDFVTQSADQSRHRPKLCFLNMCRVCANLNMLKS